MSIRRPTEEDYAMAEGHADRAIADLRAALDAEKARSAKAGRDLVLAGEQARERERALNAELTEAVMAAEARAKTAEDALARLREAAQAFRDLVLTWKGESWPDESVADALDAALDATPTDLAAASRREWKAQGMEEAAKELHEVKTIGHLDPGEAVSWHLRDMQERIAAKATKLRGER